MTLAQVEKRLAALEKEVAELKMQSPPPRTGKWYIDHAGRFKDDPVFEETDRLGREYRESLRPKAPRRKNSRRADS
jgi:hypothetical protein